MLHEAELRGALERARTLDDYLRWFDTVFDIDDSCARNLRRLVYLFLRTRAPTMNEIISFATVRHRSCDCDGSRASYALTFTWLGMLNSWRVVTRAGCVPSCCIGVEELLALRARAPELMAPTWERLPHRP